MAYAFRAAGAATVGNNTVVGPVALPAGTAAGDLLLAFLSVATGGSGSTVPTISAPSGWTQLGSTRVNQDTTAGISGAWYYRWATGSDTAPSWTLNTGSFLFKHAAVVAGWSGGPGSGAPAIVTGIGAHGSATTTNTSPTTTAASTWFAEFYSERSTTNASYTTPAGTTLRASGFGTGGAAADLLVVDSGANASGSVGSDATTAGTSGSWALNAIVVFPAASTPVNLTGFVSNVSIGAPLGALAVRKNLVGSVANVTLGAPTGTVSPRVNIAGLVANVAIGAPVGSISTGAITAAVNLAGTTAGVTLDAPVGAITITVPHVFRPPTIKQRPSDAQGERLWLYYGIDVGVSVLKNQDGTYYQTQFPSTDEINAAAIAYIGGHEYVVDDAEYQSLVDAGYLAFFGDPGSAAYGTGVYGAGVFGA